MTPTQLIENELKRFLSTQEPEVSCLSGRWGVGKTFAWNKFLLDAKNHGRIALRRYSYVSLFGINSLDECKYAIFENTIQSGEIGLEPSFKTLQENTTAAAEGLGRKFVWFVQQLPYVKTHVGGLGPLWFLSVKNTIVCIDDIERRGSGLHIRDVMGLASHLKERKGCKVLLILNDDALEEHKSEFEKYFEKVVDSTLRFAPTAAESAQIAISAITVSSQCLSDSAVSLGISNIRLIKKVERAAGQLEPLLQSFDQQVLLEAIKSLVLFGWSIYEPASAPSIEYLKGKTAENVYLSQKNVPEKEAAWNALLDSYGYRTTSAFDLALLDGLQNGYFDPALIQRYGAELNSQVTTAKLHDSLRRPWRLYHDSFDDNQAEVLDELYNSCIHNLQVMSPMDLDSSVTLFKELGQPARGGEILDRYIETHKSERALFNLAEHPFGAKITNPDLVNKFNAQFATFGDDRRVDEILLSLSQGWHPDDLELLASTSIDEYYRILKAARGEDLRKIMSGCLQFDRLGNASEDMVEFSKRAKAALVRIAQESSINAFRVKKYGIRVPEAAAAEVDGQMRHGDTGE